MESRLRMAIAALAGASFSLLATAAKAPVDGGTANATPGQPAMATATPATTPDAAHVTPTAVRPAAGNGGVRRAIPAASSAASGTADGDVQTTIEDGRRVTRNAHAPDAARVGSAPNN